MSPPRLSLTFKLFGAIGLTALAGVFVMALLVANSMRDGFAKYLLRQELVMLAPVAQELAARYDPDAPGWPELRANRYAWQLLLRDFGPKAPERPVPPGGLPPSAAGPPGAPTPGTPMNPIDTRVILLDASGTLVVGERIDGLIYEKAAITAPDAGDDAPPLGWLGLAAPGEFHSETDAFFLQSQLRALATAALVALVLSAVGAFVLARGFLVPIRALERGAQRLAGGDYAHRIANDRTDELGRLIDHTNALAASLEEAEKAQRVWISDTSHELQTPLAVLRATIEAIEDGVRPADARTLGAMAEAVERLSRLVRDLRLLSSWREEAFQAERRVTDLAEILRAGTAGAEDRFAAAGLELVEDIAGRLPVRGDPVQLRQVIDNLLENALRYTDAPGRVRLRARADDDGVQVSVDDTPPAPPDTAMAHLFDRFYRGEASRSRAHGGSGLGLAICKAIVDAHGGRISAQGSDLGGLRVAFTLPAAHDPGDNTGGEA